MEGPSPLSKQRRELAPRVLPTVVGLRPWCVSRFVLGFQSSGLELLGSGASQYPGGLTANRCCLFITLAARDGGRVGWSGKRGSEATGTGGRGQKLGKCEKQKKTRE